MTCGRRLIYSAKVVPEWICMVTSQFNKPFYCERANIAHIKSGDNLVISTAVRDHLIPNILQLLRVQNKLTLNSMVSPYWTLVQPLGIMSAPHIGSIVT